MQNCEIIQFIDRFCANKEDLNPINADLAYTILAHGYLYVRPGKATSKFMMKIIKVLKSGVKDGVDNYLKDVCETWPLDVWIRISVAKFVLKVARDAFDAKYFEEQCALLDDYEECDDSLLEKYLRLMNKEQLLSFMDGVRYCCAHHLAFTDVETEHNVEKELHELCRKLNPALPDMDDVLEYFRFSEENPDYMFDYLSNEDVANAICREIIRDVSLAGHMARMLYYTNNIDMMERYVELVGVYHRTFRGNIYAPNIFYETL